MCSIVGIVIGGSISGGGGAVESGVTNRGRVFGLS